MIFRFFTKSERQEPEEFANEVALALRERDADVDVDQDGETTSVLLPGTCRSEDLQLVSRCPKLESFRVDWCYEIDDEQLAVFSSLESLRSLEIPGARVNGSGFSHLKGHPNLRQINLDGSEVQDQYIEHLSGIPQLNSLSFRFTTLGDAGVAALESIAKLEVLHIDGTLATGGCLASIRKHKKLQVLSLPSGITGKDLQQLAGFGSLRWIWLADSQVDQQSVTDLKETLSPMCSVGWRRDQPGK